jgi:hypothetical protein
VSDEEKEDGFDRVMGILFKIIVYGLILAVVAFGTCLLIIR